PFLLVTVLFCPVIGWLLTRDAPAPFAGTLRPRHGAHAVAFAAVVVAVAAWIGAHLAYRGFGLSLDEFMADFDASIIAAGRLLARTRAEWRDYVRALQRLFVLSVPDHSAWVSLSLPMNAALRAIFVLIGDPTLEAAVLAGVAVVALHGIARRLWPDRPDAA